MYLVIFLFWAVFLNNRKSPKFWATFFGGKSYALIVTKKGLGYIWATFLQTR
jgi:hypothetical protein